MHDYITERTARIRLAWFRRGEENREYRSDEGVYNQRGFRKANRKAKDLSRFLDFF